MISTSTFRSALEWADDRLGAILVKEARQAVRSRFVVSVQFLFLAVLLVALGTVLLNGKGGGELSRDEGRDTFVMLNVMLHAVCVVCVPLYTGVRLAAERGEANVDLMFSTTIRPWSVVLGKLGSGILVGLLAASACAPFMVLCYFLRGVDLPSILFSLAVDLVFLVVATLSAVFIGALPVGAVVKGIVSLVYLSLAVGSVRGVGYEITHAMVREGGFSSLWRHSEGRVALAIALAIFAAVSGLLFMLSAAMIAPATSNRALPVRVYLTVLWVLSAAGAGLVLTNHSMREAGQVLAFGFAVCWSIIFGLGILVAGSERDALGPRLAREIPAHPFRRRLAFFFYSGATGGLLWTLCMAGATLGGAWLALEAMPRFQTMGTRVDGELLRGLWCMGIGLAMILGYVLVAGGLRRMILGRITRTVHTGVIAVGLMVAGMLLPLLFSFLVHGNGHYRVENEYFIHAFNPFSAFFYAMDGSAESRSYASVSLMCAATAAVMCAVGIALSGASLWRQARAFAPVPEEGPQ